MCKMYNYIIISPLQIHSWCWLCNPTFFILTAMTACVQYSLQSVRQWGVAPHRAVSTRAQLSATVSAGRMDSTLQVMVLELIIINFVV